MYVHMCMYTKHEKMCFHYKKNNSCDASSHEDITTKGKKLQYPPPSI